LLEGTCSGEHGIGMGKKNILLSQFGHDGIKAMKLVKTALDPLNIMNPGKVLD
jgi:D-lactate dehydrogenase (cytochrome)